MLHSKTAAVYRLITLFLCIALIVPCGVQAAVIPEIQPQASHYLNSYQTYICMVGSEVQVWFDVIGAGTQDELGVLSIKIYESTDNQNWSWVESFLFEDYSNMLVYNTDNHMSHVSYQGSANKYYKAYVCVWGGSDGDGDTRYLWAYMV